MRALVWGVLSVSLAAATGCGKSATCKNAAAHYVSLEIKEADEDERKELKKEKKERIARIAEECAEEKFSKKALKCVMKARSTDDAKACLDEE